MAELGEIVQKVRSKNAGPFWLTIDIFCGSDEAFRHVASRLKTEDVAALFNANTQELKRFDIAELGVIKFSLPRPRIQGHRNDRDMHGAGWATLIAEMSI